MLGQVIISQITCVGSSYFIVPFLKKRERETGSNCMEIWPKMSYQIISLKHHRPEAQKKPFFPSNIVWPLLGLGMLQESVWKEVLCSKWHSFTEMFSEAT